MSNPTFSFRVVDNENLVQFLQSFPRGERSPWIIQAIEEKRQDRRDNANPKLLHHIKFLMDFFEQLGLTESQYDSITHHQIDRFTQIEQLLRDTNMIPTNPEAQKQDV